MDPSNNPSTLFSANCFTKLLSTLLQITATDSPEKCRKFQKPKHRGDIHFLHAWVKPSTTQSDLLRSQALAYLHSYFMGSQRTPSSTKPSAGADGHFVGAALNSGSWPLTPISLLTEASARSKGYSVCRDGAEPHLRLYAGPLAPITGNASITEFRVTET